MSTPSFQAAADRLNKKFGNNTVLSIDTPPEPIEAISTGSLLLDKITGVGGIPRGRITELFGPEACGKTTIALQAVANAQRMGIPCVYIDMEQTFDIAYARALGVNDDKNMLLFSQPDYGEQAFEIAEAFIQGGAAGLIVLDSVAAIATKSEIEGEIGDANMGTRARLIGQALRRATPLCRQFNVAFLFINQERELLGITYGSNKTTPGGKALKFGASLRIGFNKSQRIGKQDDYTGQVIIARTEKNKLAAPFKKCAFNIEFGRGISLENEMVEIGLAAGLWTRSGAWYKINGQNVAQGAEKMTEYLRSMRAEDPSCFGQYLTLCQQFVGGIRDVDFTADNVLSGASPAVE